MEKGVFKNSKKWKKISGCKLIYLSGQIFHVLLKLKDY